ncbi:universal stress protein [Mycobacterium sp. SM1]|uniref:universal stress protein n=1 Tax=Mycobacterium sp. SM1 TaxID=2816243 RepID=UPI001BD17204|nr:universal stress protein [Mycobacterium sp. SM1]MBS4730466.1 universal stress protein [Mycobacterium sp. SM1]
MSSGVAQPGIVVGFDGSSHSEAALRWAAQEAMLRNAALTLVYVAASPQPDGQAKQALADAAALVEGMTDERSRPQIYEELISGAPVPALVDLSRKAEMVVAGCRGQRAVKRVPFGSVIPGLVQYAHCPVAVIHSEVSLPLHGPVLAGIDGSPASELVTALAFDEASRRGAELIALYAWTDAEVPALANREWTGLTRTSWSARQSAAEQTLAERLAGWQQRYPQVTVHRMVVVNRPAERLLEHAGSAQLVVVGGPRRGGFTGMLLGSVCTTVLRTVYTPVIVARQR